MIKKKSRASIMGKIMGVKEADFGQLRAAVLTSCLGRKESLGELKVS